MLLQILEPEDLDTGPQNALGIDFGTTYCVLSLATHERVDLLYSDEKAVLIPSIIAKQDGRILCGEAGLEVFSKNPSLGVKSIKRFLGTEVSPFTETPLQLATYLFEHLKSQAQERCGFEIKQAVVTVPAYFDDKRRSAIRQAALNAGFEVMRLLAEPTAAALAYGLQTQADGLFGIYDLGGGTFDFSLLKLQAGVFQVLSTGGDADLGGDDFDLLLSNKLFGIQTPEALLRAKKIKEDLSLLDHDLITKAEFEDLILPLLKKTVAIVRQTFEEKGIDPATLQGIVLVGGSTRIPFIQRLIQEEFNVKVLNDINPDEVVGLGAGYHAQSLISDQDRLLLDVTPLSLGIETMGGIMDWIIPRNTSIPVSKAQIFTTAQNGQKFIKIHVAQGEREFVAQCRSLGEFVLGPIQESISGVPRIQVVFHIDADGLLVVEAEDLQSHSKNSLTILPANKLSTEEILTVLKEAAEHARDDITKRLLFQTTIKASSLIEIVEALMPVFPVEILSEIVTAVEELKSSLKSENNHLIQEKIKNVAKITEPLANMQIKDVLHNFKETME